MDLLNIPTYGDFKEVLFWDMLIGLSKICIARSKEAKNLKDQEETENDDRDEDEDGDDTEQKDA